MAFNHCMRLAPVLGRRMASPASAQAFGNQVRTIWDHWPRTSEIRALVRDMEHQMDRFERDIRSRFGRSDLFPRLVPVAVDHTTNPEEGGQYRVSVNVGGFKPEEIDISLDEGGRTLTVKAKCDRKGKDGSRFSQEMVRQLTLPEAVDVAKLNSFLHHDGVLAIEAPFLEKPKEEPRQIPIQRTGTAIGSGGEGSQQAEQHGTSS